MPAVHSRNRATSPQSTNGMPTTNTMGAMTPFPSDLSIFDHNDEEVGDELVAINDEVEPNRSTNRQNGPNGGEPTATTSDDTSANASTIGDHKDQERLSTELLDALYLGTGNFLLAYNTRAGIGVLMRIFKLLQKGNIRAVLDLTQLLDEKHLTFRVEAVSMGLFLGWFTGGYRALRALLPRILTRLVLLYKKRQQTQQLHRQQNQQNKQNQQLQDSETILIDELSTLSAGAMAACAIVFVNAKRRRSLALYALTRALQCAYNTAKRRQVWHFWGSQWEYGDSLLFGLSSAQIMYAFIMRPSTLPSDYFRFIQKTGPVEKEVLEIVRQANRGLALDPQFVRDFITKQRMSGSFQVPEGVTDMVACRFVHHSSETCTGGFVATFRRAFVSAFPLYLSLFIVPSVVIHFKKFLARPFSTLGRAVLNATRSNAFVSSFVALYMGFICAQRRVMTKDHRFVYYVAGLVASTSILIEPKSRRSELALYVLPRALDSLFQTLRDRRIVRGVRHGEVIVFALSMAFMMRTYEHEKDSMGSFLHATLKRFLQSPTDKKKLFLAHQQQRSGSSSTSTTTKPHQLISSHD